MKDVWVEPDRRDEIVDFVDYWHDRSGWTKRKLLHRMGLHHSRYYEWRKRYNQPNEHNGQIPRWFWLTPEEKNLIMDFYMRHPDVGYRRCCYMMMDEDLVSCSPSSVYRVLSEADLMRRWSGGGSGKGKGFDQPEAPHEHWHTDISYVKIGGTFFYLITVLDGYSRYVVHFDLREKMEEKDVSIVIQKAKERYPNATPRLITDNGKQFLAKDFKELLRQKGLKHVRCSPSHPQSNGKIEVWHKTVKHECIRQKTPLSLAQGRHVLGRYVEHYNHERLHSAIGYVTPYDMLRGRQDQIHAERDRRLAAARQKRKQYWRNHNQKATASPPPTGTFSSPAAAENAAPSAADGVQVGGV